MNESHKREKSRLPRGSGLVNPERPCCRGARRAQKAQKISGEAQDFMEEKRIEKRIKKLEKRG
jgi:hypothetical protein